MRVFLVSVLLSISILNFFLGWSGSVISHEVNRVVVHDGIEISVLSSIAFAIQPWFYFLACVSLGSAVLSLVKKLPERLMVYLVVFFMALDVVGLLISVWGFGGVHFLM